MTYALFPKRTSSNISNIRARYYYWFSTVKLRYDVIKDPCITETTL